MKIFDSFIFAAAIGTAGIAYAGENNLVVGIEGTIEPFVITNPETSEYSGFDIEVIRNLAKLSGYDGIELKNMPFDALLPSVITEQVDVAISGITINEERSQIVDFVGPYFDAGLNALIRDELKDTVRDVSGLKGRTICTKQGTTCEDFTKTIPEVKIIAHPTERESFDSMLAGKCEALISDSPIILYFKKQNPKAPYYALDKTLTFEQFGIMVSKNRADTYEKIQKAFDRFKDSEEFAKIYKKWFGEK